MHAMGAGASIKCLPVLGNCWYCMYTAASPERFSFWIACWSAIDSGVVSRCFGGQSGTRLVTVRPAAAAAPADG